MDLGFKRRVLSDMISDARELVARGSPSRLGAVVTVRGKIGRGGGEEGWGEGREVRWGDGSGGGVWGWEGRVERKGEEEIVNRR